MRPLRTHLHRIVALLALLLLTFTGCSLIGVDETAATPCLVGPTASTDFTDAHATCARELGGEALESCEAWVCALRIDDEVFCVIDAPDADGDGVGDAACIPEGDERPRDCDDGDAAVAGGKAERCDGRDNDCDGIVDEGLLQRGSPQRVDETDGSAGQVAFVGASAWLRRSVAGEQALLTWQRGSAPRRVGDFTLYDPIAAADDPGLAFAVTGGAFVGVFPRNLAGCARTLVPARVEGASASSTSLELGLPDLAGDDCSGARTEPQRAPSVASLGRRSVITWIASASGGGPLRIVGATDTDGLTLSGVPEALGEATGPVALLALADESFVLAAIPRATTIELRRVELAANGAPSVSEPLATIETEAFELTLAAGGATDTHRALALAFRTGEGRGARVVVRRLSLDRTTGALTVDAETPVGDAEGQARPTLTWSDAPRGWLVAWTERAAELRARLLGADDGVAGAAITLMSATDLASAPEVRFGASLAPTETGFVVSTHATADAATGLYEIPLGCATE